MIGRLYAILFICAVAFALWYQRKYLAAIESEFHAQMSAQTSILPVNSGKKFQTFFYENGLLKQSFSGDQVTYFSDDHFQAQGHLVYTEYDKNGNSIISIQCENATGEMENQDPNETGFFGSHKQLKSLSIPSTVQFQFEKNTGSTSHVFIDALKKTIKSEKFLQIDGPNGHLESVGFRYSVDQEEFYLTSKVKGKIILPQTQTHVRPL